MRRYGNVRGKAYLIRLIRDRLHFQSLRGSRKKERRCRAFHGETTEGFGEKKFENVVAEKFNETEAKLTAQNGSRVLGLRKTLKIFS